MAGKLLLPRCKYNLTWSAGVVTLHMQVDRMFRAEAEITINPIPAGGGGQFDPPPVVFFT